MENGTERKNCVGLPLCRKKTTAEFEQVCGIENSGIYSKSEKHKLRN
tara:strand:+ start:5226 stop:5366 length:141 start_codon:yes stop_codon:yes gene_type:complete